LSKKTILLRKFLKSTRLDNATILKHINAIGLADGAEPMGNHDAGDL
jgi:hypothetical protein